MTEAFIYDAIRTPRGKGKKDGSLYEVKPINLLAGLLSQLHQPAQWTKFTRSGSNFGHHYLV